MHRCARGLLLALALLPAWAAAQPQDGAQAAGLSEPAIALDPSASPEAWLGRMNRALLTREFYGTFVYLRDGQIDALQIEHDGQTAGGGMRIASLSGELVEVRSEFGSVQLDANSTVSRWPSAAVNAPAPRVRYAATPHYQLVLGGEDRVAGRQSQILDIRPRDGFRYGYRLWLDARSALLLKSITVGSDGRAVEQLMFTALTTSESHRDDPEAVPSAPASTPAGEPGRADSGTQLAAWRVLDVPDGFTPRLVSDGDATHLLFTDGVAKVSVYVEPASAQQPTLSGPLTRGGLNAYGRVAHGRQIIAMGDVPAATVERFAHGVVPDNADRPAP